MAVPETTTWAMDRHTQAKHEILRRYLGAWLPILINYHGYARIVDGFAGPGEYNGGERGSPLITLNVLLKHISNDVLEAARKRRIELIFIERDSARSVHLQQQLEKEKRELACPAGLQTRVITGIFADEMGKLLNIMERQHHTGNAVPAFVFIDPFGYSHTPLNIIARIMRLPMCEVLITLMYEEINRFLDVDNRAKERYYDELFDTPFWRQLTQDEPDSQERMRRLHDLYRHQLLTAGGAKYVRSFRMRNRHNATDYFLFFATRHRRGLEEMKRAMWGVDPTGTFEFSDFSNPYQPLLLTEPNYGDLQRLLSNQFKGKIISLEEVDEYVLADTPYTSFKQKALTPMETDGRIRPVKPPARRRKGNFPKDMPIEFL